MEVPRSLRRFSPQQTLTLPNEVARQEPPRKEPPDSPPPEKDPEPDDPLPEGDPPEREFPEREPDRERPPVFDSGSASRSASSTKLDSATEPWLRGPIEGISALLMPLFFTFAQVREDLRTHTTDLTEQQVWARVGNNPPLGFHIRHIAGSIDRLLTYLEGRSLTDEQLLFLRREAEPEMALPELVRELDEWLSNAEDRLRRLALPDLFAPRYVGRKRLKVSALGLLVHIAEHTQRHLGQAITTAKAMRAQ